MNIKKIKELVEMMNENGLAEIEIEQEGVRIKLSKTTGGVVEQVVQTPAPVHAVAAPETQEESSVSGLLEMTSPMVGTFYRAASPEEAPYVKEGDVVQKGDVVCIVEAMKLMNEVKAEFSGKIVEIKVDNAEAVEYGQVLFTLEPV